MDKATKKKKIGKKIHQLSHAKQAAVQKTMKYLSGDVIRHATNASHGSISKGKICYLCYGEFFSSAFSRRLCTFWLARFFSTDKASSWHSIGCTHVHFDEDISIDYNMAWSRAQPTAPPPSFPLLSHTPSGYTFAYSRYDRKIKSQRSAIGSSHHSLLIHSFRIL